MVHPIEIRSANVSRRSPYSRRDARTRDAHQAGYPARSVFKLEEIDRRAHILRSGQKVLDLGAAPGSWALYAAKRVGPKGSVLAIDLKPIETAMPAHVQTLVGDALDTNQPEIVDKAPYDVVLSDMAPNTTGNKMADGARSFELFMRALDVAKAHLVPDGVFIGKIFMSEDFEEANRAVKEAFRETRTFRPQGTRKVSYEVFLFGRSLRATRD